MSPRLRITIEEDGAVTTRPGMEEGTAVGEVLAWVVAAHKDYIPGVIPFLPLAEAIWELDCLDDWGEDEDTRELVAAAVRYVKRFKSKTEEGREEYKVSKEQE